MTTERFPLWPISDGRLNVASTLARVSRGATPSATEVTSMPLTNCCRSSPSGKPAASSAGVTVGRVSMSASMQERGANATLAIDLEARELTRPDGERIAFEVEPSRRSRLLAGLDEIGATVAKAHRIDAFEAKVRRNQPWRATALDG